MLFLDKGLAKFADSSARIVLAVLVSLTLADCGGSSGGGSSLKSGTGSSVPVVTSAKGTLRVSVHIPPRPKTASAIARAVSGTRKPQYLPASVNSLTFTPIGETTGGLVVLTIGSGSCTATFADPPTNLISTGQVCVASLTAPVGTDSWTVQTYTSADGSGLALSINTLSEVIIAGTDNVAELLTLNPILASLAFAPETGSFTIGGGNQSQTLLLEPQDATGATIIGPGAFVDSAGVATPITLTASDPLLVLQNATGAATTPINVTTDNDLEFVTYNGLTATSPLTVTASAGSLTPAVLTITLAPGTISAVPSSVDVGSVTGLTTATFTVTDASVGSATFAETDNCSGSIGLGIPFVWDYASISPAVPVIGTPNYATFTVTQAAGNAGGTCTALITDGNSDSVSVQVVSTTNTLNLQGKHRSK